MLGLHNLSPAKGANKNRKRIGRGPGSGQGKTAGKGHKGQKSRSGYSLRPGFEGGQMPLQRRLPKRGFTNIFKKEWVEVNVATLEQRFEAGAEITPDVLIEAGVCSKRAVSTSSGIVILGHGDISKAFKISAHRVSKTAREKVEKAGGSVAILGAAVEAS